MNDHESDKDNVQQVNLLLGDGEAEAPGLYVGLSGKQPNFLQKLYDFMALDPHPCPDIIYWAADSKQLVIAQPDRLAREVLPRLFKHDKISSFGRQLNIYGFSRMFPGRQFKDAEGRVSDASVWSHPSLTRMSSPSEVLAVRRRAAPKLFRTRRLANGQLIRTRAGPGVEAKFREIRDEMAESRRVKSMPSEDGYASCSTSSTGRSYAFANDEVEDAHMTQKSRIATLPADLVTIAPAIVEVQHYGSLPHLNTSIAAPASLFKPTQRAGQVQGTKTAMPFWDRGRDYHASYLESINENAPSSWETGFSGLVESAPVTAAPAQSFATLRNPSYRYATASFSGASASPAEIGSFANPTFQQPPTTRHEPVFQATSPLDNHIARLQGLSSIAIQSCPASIHTSPILKPQEVSMPDSPTRDDWSSNTESAPHPSYRPPAAGIFAALQMQSAEGLPHLAHPQTDQFLLISPTPAYGTSGVGGHQDKLAAAFTGMSEPSSATSYNEAISPLQSARSSMVWDQGDTIDPRWVSNPNSTWTTPAVTPRLGSPVNGIPPYPQL